MPATYEQLLLACGLPRLEASLLMTASSGLSREKLVIASRDIPASDIEARFRDLAARRSAGEPIAYLTGRRAFYGRDFTVGPAVLIPRPETEHLVDEVLAFVDGTAPEQPRRVLDLGTGSGVIAITLALERPALTVVATDVSAAALGIARRNAREHGAPLKTLQGSWYDALPGGTPRFDVVVANPPYIAAGDRHLCDGDLRFEPAVALTDGDDGLSALRIIVAGASTWLLPGGLVAVEHGHDQAGAVRTMLAAAGLENIASRPDLAGIERLSRGAVPHRRL